MDIAYRREYSLSKPMSRNVSYANVTATLALVIATSGVSYAATMIPRNSVGSA